MAKSEKFEPVWSHCNNCGVQTRHDILCQSISTGDDQYSCWMQHAVIECRGCTKRSFRYHFKDIENAWPIDDDEWDMPEEIECYPKKDDNSLRIDGEELVPDIVEEIYRETRNAIQEGSLILAGLGLRGTIEAVCYDQKVGGGTLDKMIKGLVSKGMISKKDGERLHAIRFLGNDAAHEIKKPKIEQIWVAVKIVKHLIASVYTLQQEADGKLETVISEFHEYLKLLEECLKTKKAGHEVPLAAIFERNVRRLGDNRADLEKLLIADIQAGAFPKLAVGKVDNYAGSKDQLQHYIVI